MPSPAHFSLYPAGRRQTKYRFFLAYSTNYLHFTGIYDMLCLAGGRKAYVLRLCRFTPFTHEKSPQRYTSRSSAQLRRELLIPVFH
jgi:hypothetical protein